MRYVIIFTLLLSLACKSQKNISDKSESKVSEPEGLTMILSDNYGGPEVEELRVIRTQGELKKFFSGINKTRKPGIPVPEIDFSKEMVIVYCAGETTNTETPELLTKDEGEFRIVLTPEIKKSLDYPSSSAYLLPFALYTLPITEKDIVLDQRK